MVDTAFRCQKLRWLRIAWCIVESFLFGGLFFGWTSLVYIFKEEGIYSFLCNEHISNLSVNTQLQTIAHESISHARDDGEMVVNVTSDISTADRRSCPEQDAILNLWFTIAVSVLSLATALIGWVLYRFGPLVLRLMGSGTFCAGTLMLAFVNHDVPWLICPGLLCMSFGAVSVSAANLQVIPHLFYNGSSIVVSSLTGFYYSAVTTQWLIKVAFEHGISRQHSYILLASLNAVLVTTNTMLFFRRNGYSVKELTAVAEESTHPEQQSFSLRITDANLVESSLLEKLPESQQQAMDATMLMSAQAEVVIPPLRSCIFSRTFLFHLFWFVANDFYLLTFIGVSNAMIERIVDEDEQKVNQYTDVFSYCLMGAAIFSVSAGLLYDCQRMAFRGRQGSSRYLFSAVFPITMTTLLGAVTVVLQFYQSEEVLVPLFVLLVMYKQCVFAMTFSFIVDVYPKKYFGVFYGIVFTVAGVVLFLQYPVFSWLSSSPSGPHQVNTFFLCLILVSLLSPLNMLIQGVTSQTS